VYERNDGRDDHLHGQGPLLQRREAHSPGHLPHRGAG
jgi:hypothetical protein